MDGYTLTSINVTEAVSKKNINVLNNSFTMPGCDVEVKLTFGKTDNAIVINAALGGKLVAYDYESGVKGSLITEAMTGDKVLIEGEPDTAEGFDYDFCYPQRGREPC